MKINGYFILNGEVQSLHITDLKRGLNYVKFERARPHGEWVRTGRTNVYGGFEIECSHCHTKLMVSPGRWEIGENFCDVCGARMREGDSDA